MLMMPRFFSKDAENFIVTLQANGFLAAQNGHVNRVIFNPTNRLEHNKETDAYLLTGVIRVAQYKNTPFFWRMSFPNLKFCGCSKYALNH